jgi:hypothetical protein
MKYIILCNLIKHIFKYIYIYSGVQRRVVSLKSIEVSGGSLVNSTIMQIADSGKLEMRACNSAEVVCNGTFLCCTTTEIIVIEPNIRMLSFQDDKIVYGTFPKILPCIKTTRNVNI